MAQMIDARSEFGDKSLGELLKELMEQVSLLIKQEVALVRAEMTEKAKELMMASVLMVVAGFIGVLAAGVMTATIVIAIAIALPTWLAALIVTVAYLMIAALLVLAGLARLRQAGRPMPEQTIETIGEDISWLKQQVKRQSKSAET